MHLSGKQVKQKAEQYFLRLVKTYKQEISEGGKENLDKKRKRDKERIYQKRQSERSIRGVLNTSA